MKNLKTLIITALVIVSVPLFAQESKPPESRDQQTDREKASKGDSWTKAVKDRAKRGTLHDALQNVRGDTGKWNDEPLLQHVPPIGQKPAKMPLDDWADQLLKPDFKVSSNEDNWLLFRTRQLDDNDRVWVERIERRGKQFTVVVSEAIWQGRYSKTFTYYSVLGVNLGKLEPGKYEVKWIINPLAFEKFEGDGKPTDNWPKAELPADKTPTELRVRFNVVVATVAAPPASTVQEADSKQFAEQVQPLLARHCVDCHRGDKPKGNLRLDNLTSNFADAATRKHWTEVVERLRAGEMPPKTTEKPRPTEKEIQSLTDWLAHRVIAADAAERAAQGRVILRRLNRVEYENTVNDLLGINASLKEQLPADGSANGFDNAGAAHHTSSFLMEKYLEAADTALNAAIANRPKPPSRIDKRYSMKDTHGVKSTTEDVYRFLEDGEVVCFCSSEWHNVGVTHFYPPDAGNYRFRISASGIQSDDKPVTFRVTASGTRLTGKSGLVSYFDAPPDKPTVFEFIRYMEPRTTISMLPYGLAGANTVKQTGGEYWNGPGLAIQYVEVEGPLNETWPPESHRRIFGDMPQKKFPIYNFSDRLEVVSDEPLVDAERILTKFTRRAFRRTVTADDVAPFVAIVQTKLDGGYTFELAMRAALKGVLISPEFLFLRERPGKLDDFSLACRLSYFLWSSMPDDELFDLADTSTIRERVGSSNDPNANPSLSRRASLSDPEVLRQQVERLLTHPKVAAFTENFVGQWLGLREIDATEPSHIVYPEFDHLLKVSMICETELFFDEVLKHDLSLTNFVASDFTMLNGRLGKHYGIPGLTGWEFHKTPLPADSHRGGVLTMAGVMKVTANGTTTSPVMRGAWVLDRILGTPPPPPPGDVAAIDPDIRGATTIREQLAKHRTDPACASCHSKIDPPGFALESFDCIGGWRDWYRVTGNGGEVKVDGRRMPYHKGKPVDPSNVTEDGLPFQNIDEFRRLLLRDKDQLARSLTVKLMTYATGGAPTKADRSEIEAIVARVRHKNFGFRSLLHEVVQSELFQNK